MNVTLGGRMWDLSQPIAHDGVVGTEYDPPNITRDFRRAIEGYNVETVRMSTHTGTHVDAPLHFFDDGAAIDEMPLSAFAAPAVFVDLRDCVRPGEPIPVDALRSRLDPVRPGDIAVLMTGWGERRAISEEFLKRWPYLDGDAARALLDRDVAGVGIDAMSVGGYGEPGKIEPPHLALLSAGKIIVEDLRVPAELAGRRCFLTAFPVLLRGCGGAWTRAVAWELA